MVLTHLVFYSFLGGAGRSSGSMGGSSSLPPYYLFNGFSPSGSTTPPVIASGVKRRYRVRRADFSTQENYEIALRMALQGAHFTVREEVEPKAQPKPRARTEPPPKTQEPPKDKGRIAEMLVRAIEDDYQIGTQEQILALQKPMTELELLALFLTIVE